jgi:hypothetical protein
MNPYTGVLLLVSDDAGTSSVGKELDAVVGDRNTKDCLNKVEHGLGGVDHFMPARSTSFVGRRVSNAASNTPTLSTKLSRRSLAASRARNPSRT